jgi:glutathione synthase/RimK-type ligase-like ATP-grasp enzyme
VVGDVTDRNFVTHSPNLSPNDQRPHVLLLTDADGFFGCRLMPWETMNIDVIKQTLSRHFTLEHITYGQIARGASYPQDSIIIHSSSQQPEYKSFIDDIMLYLYANGNLLVPSIHVVRSHENKGYQELHKRLRGVLSPPALYAAKLSDLGDRKGIEYPIVFKEVSGFGSVGVRLLRTGEDLDRASVAEARLSFREAARELKKSVGYLIRKHILGRQGLRPYGNYYQPLKRFVLQRYFPDLDHDLKVLVFQKRVYVLKRGVRPGDFRASGSGRFRFEAPPESLLDFAMELLRRFDEPYLSLDICEDDSGFHLLEFQGAHFGPYTLLEAPMHYALEDGHWRTCLERPGLEEVVAESLAIFIRKRIAEFNGSADPLME